jgi:hypothetical protein
LVASDWPVDLRGVTELVVTTPTGDGRWNLAALGVHAPEAAEDEPTARTWGDTRTRRNFADHGVGYVQFTRDPVDFAEAALTVRAHDRPRLDSADAWVRVEPTRIGRGTDAGTEWVDWRLEAREIGVERRRVPTTNRGFAAVIEATVAASRLDVPAYDREALRARLEQLASVVETCGGPAEQRAFDVIRDATDR